MESDMQSLQSMSVSGGMGSVPAVPDFSSHATAHALTQAAMALLIMKAAKDAEQSPENIARQAKATAAWEHALQLMRQTVERHRQALASTPGDTPPIAPEPKLQ